MVEHKDEKMYVPALIFGHLLTSSNYDDDEKKVTGEKNPLITCGYTSILRKLMNVATCTANFYFGPRWKERLWC